MRNSKGLEPYKKHHNYVLSSENWEDTFDMLLHLVKEFIVAGNFVAQGCSLR